MPDEILTEFKDKYLGGGSVKEFSKAISSTSNASWIYHLIINFLNNNISNVEKGDLDSLKDILDIDVLYLEDALIDTANGEFIYKYRKDIIEIVKRLEKIVKKNNIKNKEINSLIDELKKDDLTDVIIETHNPKYIYKYARDIKDANVARLEKEIIRCRNPKYIYMFAKDVGGADISKLLSAILDIGNVKYMYLFAKYIDVDTKIFEELIEYSKSPEFIYLFAKNIENMNISVLEDAILETKNIKYKLAFAKNIDCDFERFEYDAIESGNPEYIYKLALYKKYNTKELEYAIKRTSNPEYIYLFAKNIRNANPKTLGDAVVRTNSAEYMYLFAVNIAGADTEYIGNMIFRTKEIEWIYKFTCDVFGVNIYDMIDRIKKLNLDPKYEYITLLVEKFLLTKDTQVKETKTIVPIEKVDIDEYINELLKTKDAKKLFDAARKYKHRLFEIGSAILKLGNPEYIYKFAYTIKFYEVTKFEDTLIKLGNPEYIYKFALNIHGASIEKACDALLKIGDIKYIYLLLISSKDPYTKKLLDYILKSNNPEYIYLVALNVPSVDISYIEDLLFKIGNIEWIYKFVDTVSGVNIDCAIDRIRQNNLDPDENYIMRLIEKHIFGKDIKNDINNKGMIKIDLDLLLKNKNYKKLIDFVKVYKVRLDEIGKVILESNNPKYIYKFVYLTKYNDDNHLFEDKIIKLSNPEYIYKYALNIRSANIRKLTDAIISTHDGKYIKLFSQNINPSIMNILEDINTNFKDVDTLLKTPYDLYEIILSLAFNKEIDIVELSKKLSLPRDTLRDTIEFMNIKYRSISYNGSIKDYPICKENIPKLGRMYDDVYNLIKEFKDIDKDDMYISNLIEKYYLEDNQDFLEDGKEKVKTFSGV